MSLLETQKKKEKEKQIREENRLKKHKCIVASGEYGQKRVINVYFQNV